MSEDPDRLLVISPVRNEVKHIDRVVRAMAGQTRPPDLWLVADNSSDDGTLEVLRKHEVDMPFLRIVEVPPLTEKAGADRLAQAIPARVFNRALAEVDWEAFTHLGNLDGDIELPSDYFDRMLEKMRRDPRLGITGGSIIEPSGPGGSWRPLAAPAHHVHGALRLLTEQCFESVGGVQESPIWDTVDETYARMYGYRTERDRDLVARHHRPVGSADGLLRGRNELGSTRTKLVTPILGYGEVTYGRSVL